MVRTHPIASLYRPDIDGLRAVAVVPVLLFHAGLSCPGGYVGVDVFFVISGYLITKLIADEQARGAFSVARFYERRIRRIFPALFALLAFCLVAGACMYTPSRLKNLGQTVVATVAFASNVLFWTRSGYFDPAAESKPLLHTWSLSVEEQFYLVFPLLLWLLRRVSTRARVGVLALIAVVSLAASAAVVASPAKSAAFYLAHYRAWELLLGALVALGAFPAHRWQLAREASAWMGLALIGWSVASYGPLTAFPGLAALAPCAGAALLIHAGEGGSTLAVRGLSWRPVVAVGLVSYSLYLWHWPLLVFARYLAVEPLSGVQAAGVLALSGACAAASWRWVERPFRGHGGWFSRRAVFAAGGAAMGAAALAGAIAHASGGWPGRFDRSAWLTAAEADRPPVSWAETAHVLGDTSRPGVDFIVWGDSHALSLAPAMDAAGRRMGMRGLLAARMGCPPLEGAWPRAREAECRRHSAAALELARGARHVVLVARWLRYVGEEPSSWLGDGADEEPSLEANRRVMASGLRKTLAAIRRSGARPVVVGPVPEFAASVPELAFRGRDTSIALAAFLREAAWPLAELQRLGAALVQPSGVLCDDERCYGLRAGAALYTDDNHLSLRGAGLVAPLIERAMAGRPSLAAD